MFDSTAPVIQLDDDLDTLNNKNSKESSNSTTKTILLIVCSVIGMGLVIGGVVYFAEKSRRSSIFKVKKSKI